MRILLFGHRQKRLSQRALLVAGQHPGEGAANHRPVEFTVCDLSWQRRERRWADGQRKRASLGAFACVSRVFFFFSGRVMCLRAQMLIFPEHVAGLAGQVGWLKVVARPTMDFDVCHGILRSSNPEAASTLHDAS